METLTLEQASYLAEIIGVIAVVTSLIYLALQVRSSNQTSLIESLGTFSPRLDKCFEFLTIPENICLILVPVVMSRKFNVNVAVLSPSGLSDRDGQDSSADIWIRLHFPSNSDCPLWVDSGPSTRGFPNVRFRG